jgi:hypothetical protein
LQGWGRGNRRKEPEVDAARYSGMDLRAAREEAAGAGPLRDVESEKESAIAIAAAPVCEFSKP